MMKKLRLSPTRVGRWVAAIVTLMLAAALCISCLDLYQTGNAPENLTESGVRINDVFTRENVGEKLSALAVPTICWALLLIKVSMLPKEPEKRVPLDPENALRLLRPRVIPTGPMEKIRTRRKVVERIVFLILAMCGLWLYYYFSCQDLFTLWDLEFVMGLMLQSTWVASLIAVVVMCLWAWWEGCSFAAEWEEAKKAPRREHPLPSQKPSPFWAKATHIALPVSRVVLLAAAIALIAAGVLNGGMYDVLVKAINICTECIGLG